MEKSVSQAPVKHLTILHRQFNDVDQMAEAMNSNGRRQLQLSQLSLQRFRCGLLSIGFDEARFVFMEMSCPLRGQGYKVAGYLEFDFILEAQNRS